MGRIVIACYRPREAQDATLRELIAGHVATLRAEGLATDRPCLLVHAADGTYLEIFEWTSPDAMEAAHENATVQAMWARFEQVCDYVTLADLAESKSLFAEFTPADEILEA